MTAQRTARVWVGRESGKPNKDSELRALYSHV